MKKETITHLIEDNRLKEALELLKQATKSTHLENQVIILSANYEENVKMANIGMESPTFILEKRAQIVNGLLNITDNLIDSYPEKEDITPSVNARHEASEEPPNDASEPLFSLHFLRILKKSVVMSLVFGGIAAIVYFLFMFIPTLISTQTTAPTTTPVVTNKPFDLEIIAVQKDGKTPFTEGVKIELTAKDWTDKKVIFLEKNGSTHLKDLPYTRENQTITARLLDTSLYRIAQQQLSNNDVGKLLNLQIYPQTDIFQGKIVNTDGQTVADADIVFGNFAQVRTNAAGAYVVELPKKIVGEAIEIMISKDKKILINRKVMVDEKVLATLKVR